MAEEVTSLGQQTSSDAAGGGQQSEPTRTFTQQEVDRIIAERLGRQKAQFADYEDLKGKAAKWAEYENAQKTEQERTAAKVAQLERERDEALAKSNDRLIRAAFVAEAARAGAVHPNDVYALADLAGIQVDADGNVQGVAEAVQAIVTAGRIPLATNRPAAPRLDGGAGGGARTTEAQMPLTDEELAMAKRMGIAPEKYAARKVELKQARR